MTTPDWLARRGNDVKRGPDGATWFVLIAGQPTYALTVVPVAGKFSSQVKQTINGRRLDSGAAFGTPEAAIAGGLEELRNALGW